MSNKSLMSFLFHKASRPSSRSGGPIVQRGLKAVEPVPVSLFNRPEVNTFTLSEKDLDPGRNRAHALDAEREPPSDKASEDQSSIDGDHQSGEEGNAAELIHQIREALMPQGDFLSIPAEAVLAHLPKRLRGPKWPGDTPTGVQLLVDKDSLLQKLRSGVIRYCLGEFLPDLQEGWAIPEPKAEVTLDLPTVVKAIPSELFGPAVPSSHKAMSGEDERDYFSPTEPPDAPPAIADSQKADVCMDDGAQLTSSEPEPEPDESSAGRRALFGDGVGPKREVVPIHIPGAWNGIESGLDASIAAVDINLATVEALQALPGVGPERARMIVKNREAHGPFDGIYDLLRIRGIGRRRFVRLTGLSLRRRDRRDRHEVLNALIGLPLDDRPGFPEIVCRIKDALDCLSCSLIGSDGVVLSSSSPQGTNTELRAVMIPVFFRRTTRYLNGIAAGASDCVTFPFADPPLMLFAVDRCFMALELKGSDDAGRVLSDASAIACELSWLLGPHAVVR